ncbi:MAG TPA: polysaccharide export protein [Candidatus Avacidaminococcus intestinavium]|uniref:Polysaccharide export protein n=1 Tax=Candidatus Avacidaminococcus intestinavium TaxID=2840684 RepID=A0A9D1MR41_9FIRM|nr:polysaccharide export protein [Candidatus Avacidaminococcus intestinavium]
MRKKLLTLLVAGSCLLGAPQAQADEYQMAPGDKLSITVLGHEDLSTSLTPNSYYVVRPDGKVSFPLIGEIDTAGMNIEEFTKTLQANLAEYLVAPQVTVNIAELGTTRVYVLGEVNKPGLYELTKSHNVLDAIGVANGFTKDAAKKKVFLVRSNHEGEPIKVNLNDILKKADLTQNYKLGEGDLLYLTSNGRIDFSRDVMPFISGAYMIDRINNDD